MDPRTVYPESFAWCEWWQPLRPGRPWFYHQPRQLVASPSLTVDYATLDPGVAGLVGKLHGYGVPTWPTCDGHWFSESSGRAMFADLQRDAAAIRSSGLVFKHTETGQRVSYYNPSWRLPWEGWHSFFQSVSRGNGRGLVAFSPPEGSALWSWRPRLAGVRVDHAWIGAHPAVLCRVQTSSPSSQRTAWDTLTRTL